MCIQVQKGLLKPCPGRTTELIHDNYVTVTEDLNFIP